MIYASWGRGGGGPRGHVGLQQERVPGRADEAPGEASAAELLEKNEGCRFLADCKFTTNVFPNFFDFLSIFFSIFLKGARVLQNVAP